MFHTFNTSTAESSGGTPAKRHKSTSHACDACRKRKTRCDGKRPCEACKSRRKQSRCTYSAGAASPQTASQNATGPYLTPELSLQPVADDTGDWNAPTRQSTARESVESQSLDDADGEADWEAREHAKSLEQIQTFPEASSEESHEDENLPQTQTTPRVTDDINALSLRLRKSSSYLGLSSVMAILRVIQHVDPHCGLFTHRPKNHAGQRNEHRNLERLRSSEAVPSIPSRNSVWEEIPIINAYFQYVHPIIPVLDEDSFKDVYLNSSRTDSRWKLLANTVLAMGCVASSNAADAEHAKYYNRAKIELGLSLFSFAHIETIQALTILSGMYLHYIQQPQLAHFLMGAVFRMATTIGLHRDYSEYAMKAKDPAIVSEVELRRRLWWCLVVLDGWNLNHSGLPTIAPNGQSQTTKIPCNAVGSTSITRLMQENIDSCILNTRLDSALAKHLVLTTKQRHDLDQAFRNWLHSSSVQKTQVSPSYSVETGEIPGVIVARNMMRWRCFNSQILVHRPLLLWYAMSRRSISSLSSSEQESIKRCCDLAADLINDVHETWQQPKQCQMSGWYATWQLYQAVLVPILLLFCDQDYPHHAERCNTQIQTATTTFMSLELWSPAAKRTTEVVTRLFEASKSHHQAYQSKLGLSPTSMISTQPQLERQSVQNFEQPGFSMSADQSTPVSYIGLDDIVTDLGGFAPTEYDGTLSFLDFWNPAIIPYDTGSSSQ